MLVRSQLGIGRRTMLFAVLFPRGAIFVWPAGLCLRVVLGRERRNRREKTQREKKDFFHNNRFNPGDLPELRIYFSEARREA